MPKPKPIRAWVVDTGSRVFYIVTDVCSGSKNRYTVFENRDKVIGRELDYACAMLVIKRRAEALKREEADL